MNRFRRYDVVEHSPFHSSSKSSSSTLFTQNTTMLNPYYYFPTTIEDEIDLLTFTPPLSFYDEFDAITDLIHQIHDPPPLLTSHRHVTRFGSDHHLHALCDRVSALELLREERLMRNRMMMIGDRKCRWTGEIKSPERERKYKVTTEVKDSRRSQKWTAEIKGRGGGGEYCYPVERTYRIKVGDNSDSESDWEEEQRRKRKIGKGKLTAGRRDRIVEIEDHRAGVFRQRLERKKGKRKEFSPQNAAALIQTSFRSHLHRRSQTLRVIRELTVAKTKLREIRALFNNFSYRHRLARDGEERQRFSEKIIVLLLTIDAIEGSDLVTRAAKKSMTNELESMLDAVDPQHAGKSMSMRRRTFDMPDGMMNKELAAGVAQVVQMLDQEPSTSESLEACL